MRAPLLLVLPLCASAALADPPGMALPVPAAAGTLLTPDQFEAYATGKTLAYAQDGVIWGRETYLPGRHVLWRAVGEDCKPGHWWAQGQAVCFTYENSAEPQCWSFAQGPTGLTATFLNTAGSAPATASQEPNAVPCPGPDVGS
jgi:transcription elongation factor